MDENTRSLCTELERGTLNRQTQFAASALIRQLTRDVERLKRDLEKANSPVTDHREERRRLEGADWLKNAKERVLPPVQIERPDDTVPPQLSPTVEKPTLATKASATAERPGLTEKPTAAPRGPKRFLGARRKR